MPVPDGGLAADFWQILAVDLVGSDVLAEEVDDALALHPPDGAFYGVGGTVEAEVAQGGKRSRDGHGGANGENAGEDQAVVGGVGDEVGEGETFLTLEEVENDEGVVFEGVAGAVGLHEPFAGDALAFLEELELTAVFEHPVVEMAVLLVGRGDCREAGAAEGEEFALVSGDGDVRPVELFLNDDDVVPVAGFFGEDAVHTGFELVVARAETGAREVADGPVGFVAEGPLDAGRWLGLGVGWGHVAFSMDNLEGRMAASDGMFVDCLGRNAMGRGEWAGRRM